MLGQIHQKKYVHLILGFLIGITFGFLLQKGNVTDYNVIINQLLLKDFTVFKIILSAILTGMIGIYIMKKLGYIDLKPKPSYIKKIIIGGLIFGVGFAILGYCPGTAAGAFGSGSIDAFFGMIGLILGAGIFASIYPKVKNKYMKKGLGKVTISDITNTHPLFFLTIFSISIIIVLYLLEILVK